MNWNKEKSYWSEKKLITHGYTIQRNEYPPYAYKISPDPDISDDEIFDILTYKEWEALEFLCGMQQPITMAILAIPTGEIRNELTDVNILLLQMIKKLKRDE